MKQRQQKRNEELRLSAQDEPLGRAVVMEEELAALQ